MGVLKMKFVDIVFRPERYKNLERYGEGGEFDCCYICWRPVKDNSKYWIHVVRGGLTATNQLEPMDGDEEPGDMHLFPVGPECKKQFPDAFIFDGDIFT
jgi:hypothetical protein